MKVPSAGHLLLLTLLVGCSTAKPNRLLDAEPGRFTVTRVLDGDTFEVVVGGADVRVRLIGIDAAESGECMSERAAAALTELVAAGVGLVPDVAIVALALPMTKLPPVVHWNTMVVALTFDGR